MENSRVTTPITSIENFKISTENPRSFLDEVRTSLEESARFSDQISFFTKKREAFGCKLLTGQYEDAERISNEIETLTGVSIYSIEKKLILKYLSKGDKEAEKLFTSYNLKTADDLLRFIIQRSWDRIRMNTSISKHSTATISQIENSPRLNTHKTFLIFTTTTGFIELNKEQIGLALNTAGTTTYIDRYLAALKAIRLALAQRILSERELGTLEEL